MKRSMLVLVIFTVLTACGGQTPMNMVGVNVGAAHSSKTFQEGSFSETDAWNYLQPYVQSKTAPRCGDQPFKHVGIMMDGTTNYQGSDAGQPFCGYDVDMWAMYQATIGCTNLQPVLFIDVQNQQVSDATSMSVVFQSCADDSRYVSAPYRVQR